MQRGGGEGRRGKNNDPPPSIQSSVHENTRGKRATWDDDSWGDFNRNEEDQDKTYKKNPLVPTVTKDKTSPKNRRPTTTKRYRNPALFNHIFPSRPKTKATSREGNGRMRPVSGPPAKAAEYVPDYDESGERELTEQEKIDRHRMLAEENVHVGLMFGSKALVQLIANPWVGPLTNK